MVNFLKRLVSARSSKEPNKYKGKLSGTNTTDVVEAPGTGSAPTNAPNRALTTKNTKERQHVFSEIGMTTWRPPKLPKRAKSEASTPTPFPLSKLPRRTWSESWSRRRASKCIPQPDDIAEPRPREPGVGDKRPVVDERELEEEKEVNPTASVISLKSFKIKQDETEVAEEVKSTPPQQSDTAPVDAEQAPEEPARASTPDLQEDEPPLARYLSPPPSAVVHAQILNPHSAVTRKPPVGIVTINVNGTPYFIHKDYLMFHSAYFRSALAGPWIECSKREINFDDEDIEVPPFNILVHWLYTQRLPSSLEDWVKIAQAPARKIEIVKLKALVLADRFLMPGFMRDVNNDLVNGRMTHAPYYELIIYAFANLPPSSPVLQCLVDLHCLHWNPEHDENDDEEMELRPQLPYDFLMRVMVRYGELQVGTKGKTDSLDPCDYYIRANEDGAKNISSRGY